MKINTRAIVFVSSTLALVALSSCAPALPGAAELDVAYHNRNIEAQGVLDQIVAERKIIEKLTLENRAALAELESIEERIKLTEAHAEKVLSRAKSTERQGMITKRKYQRLIAEHKKKVEEEALIPAPNQKKKPTGDLPYSPSDAPE